MAEFKIFSEILDKLIDTQVHSARVTSDLKNSIEDNNRSLKELQSLITKIDAHFSNGFRQEIKDAILESVRCIDKKIDEKATEGEIESAKILKAVTDFTSAIKSPKSWIGAFLLLASIFGTVAGIITVISKIMGGSWGGV